MSEQTRHSALTGPVHPAAEEDTRGRDEARLKRELALIAQLMKPAHPADVAPSDSARHAAMTGLLSRFRASRAVRRALTRKPDQALH
jgi:hypothetical protein